MLLDREIDEIVTEKGPGPGKVPCRRPSVSDALLLILALGVAIAWDRGRYLDGARWISLPRGSSASPGGWPMTLLVYAINGVELLPPFLITGSLAVTALRLRKPRPARGWIFRQPGSSACAVASVAIVAISLFLAAVHLASPPSGHVVSSSPLARRLREDLMPEHLTAVSTVIGYGVAGTWIALVARRRWRPEPGWIDGLGLLVGAGWIVMVFGGMMLPIVHIIKLGLP